MIDKSPDPRSGDSAKVDCSLHAPLKPLCQVKFQYLNEDKAFLCLLEDEYAYWEIKTQESILHIVLHILSAVSQTKLVVTKGCYITSTLCLVVLSHQNAINASFFNRATKERMCKQVYVFHPQLQHIYWDHTDLPTQKIRTGKERCNLQERECEPVALLFTWLSHIGL